MPKPPTAPGYVLAFIQAVCPDAPALYAASFSEKTCLQDATEIILRYREALDQVRQSPHALSCAKVHDCLCPQCIATRALKA